MSEGPLPARAKSTAADIDFITASISCPSTISFRMAYESARSAKSLMGVLKLILVYSPYKLFSITKMIGSLKMLAIFNVSWNAPIFVEPSPKIVNATESFFLSFAARATPAATGKPAPTIANVGISPTEASIKCIDPPMPPEQPITLPQISPSTPSGETPKAKAAACPRYVQVTTSVGLKTLAIPTETASCPLAKCVLPRT